MIVAKIPQPWASLLMTEAVEYILPLDNDVLPGEVILIYAISKDERYNIEFERIKVDELWNNEMTLGNLDEELETEHFLGYVKVLDVFPRKRDKIYVGNVHCFEKPVYSKHARPSADILKNPCKKKNYDTITFKSIRKGINEIVIPLGREDWENLVFQKEDIYLYWNEEFRGLTDWINSFKDKKGFWDEQFDVVFKYNDRKVVWTMLNDSIHKTYIPLYETNEQTGKKIYAGNIDVLYIGIIGAMGMDAPDSDILDEERKLFQEQKVKEPAKTNKQWTHIIYTPMGNKR